MSDSKGLEAASAFLKTLFEDALEAQAGHLLIWSVNNKKSHWFNDTAKAAACAIDISSSGNVYVGCGLREEVLGSSNRGGNKSISCLIGLWADIDVVGPTHSEKKYPPTFDDAHRIISALGLRPTLTVMSGGGLQPWWLFNEPWVLDDDERPKAAGLATAWHNTIFSKAKDLNMAVDSVKDLARILRIPGTLNHKHDPPLEVGCVIDGIRYNPDDFEDFLIAPISLQPTTSVVVYDIILNPNAGVPDVVVNLIENSRKFKSTWNHKRRDMPDDTSSGYDMAIANEGVYHDWTDQQIADAIICFRRKHLFSEEKSMRPTKGGSLGYISLTIQTARASHKKSEAITRLSHAPVPDDTTDPKEVRATTLKYLSDAFKVNVTGFIMDGQDEPDYYITVDNQNLLIGSEDQLKNPSKFWNIIYRVTQGKVVLPTIKSKEWKNVLQWIGLVMRQVENVDQEPSFRVASWVQQYIEKGEGGYIASEASWEDALPKKQPFLRDGSLWVHGPAVLLDLRRRCGEQVAERAFWRLLRKAGWQSNRVSVRIENKVLCRSYWALPLDSLPDGIQVDILIPDEPDSQVQNQAEPGEDLEL